MAGAYGIITGVVVANSGATFMARILGHNGNPITQSSISSISYTVRNLRTATTSTTATALTPVSSYVYNDLQQNDPRWTRDSAADPGLDGRWGFNFLAALGASLFTDFDVETEEPYKVTGSKMQVSVHFTPASGAVFVVPFQFTPIPTW